MDEAKGRQELAEYLATETAMSVEQAKGVLAKAAKGSGLDRRMAAAQIPDTGADAPKKTRTEGLLANARERKKKYDDSQSTRRS